MAAPKKAKPAVLNPHPVEDCAEPRLESYATDGVMVTRCQECGAHRVDKDR